MMKSKMVSMHVLASMPHSHKKHYAGNLISKMDTKNGNTSIK